MLDKMVDEYIAKRGVEGVQKDATKLQFAAQAIGAVDGYLSALEQRKAQERSFKEELEYRRELFKHQLTQYRSNAKRLRATTQENYRRVMDGIEQARISSSLEMFNIIKQSRKAHASAIVGSAERGVYGQTADLLLDDILRNELGKIGNVAMEEEWGEKERTRQLDSIYADSESKRLAMLPGALPPPETPQLAPLPNIIGDLMSVAAGTLTTWAGFEGQKKKGTTPPGNAGITTTNVPSSSMAIRTPTPTPTLHHMGRSMPALR